MSANDHDALLEALEAQTSKLERDVEAASQRIAAQKQEQLALGALIDAQGKRLDAYAGDVKQLMQRLDEGADPFDVLADFQRRLASRKRQ
jgi:hypothetical protein